MDPSNLLQQFVETVQDPTADPRRTVALIAIGLLLFLIVAVLVFILLPPEKREDDDEWAIEAPTPIQTGRQSKILLAVTLLLILVVLVGFAYGDRRGRQDAACRSCHVLQPVVDSWEASSHPTVACIECHASPGVFGGVETRVRALADLAKNLGGTKTLTAPATVNQDNCRSCHEKELSGVLTVGNLRVRHLDFVDRLPCRQCHGRVGHDPAGAKSPAPSAMMTTCADCHDGKTASRDCSTCHVGDIAQAGSGPEDYARVQLGSPATCVGCHSLEGCNECHGIEMPHPQDWADPKNHAPAGAFDTTVCVRCHDAGCNPCHMQIHVNHGPNWKAEHKTTTDRSLCIRCHDPQKVGTDMCRLCHA